MEDPYRTKQDERKVAPGTVARALLSVYDKTGIVELARRLRKLDIEILASGGTAATLEEAGVAVTRIEHVTETPDLLDGRVKSLHPRIHAGVLADRRNETHRQQLVEHRIRPIDLVVCNLYPFETVWASGATHDEIVENIDIGGPALLRAGAKNADGGVTVVVDPADHERVIHLIEKTGAVPGAVRRELAATAFEYTARYDAVIARWAAETTGDPSPALGLDTLRLVRELRYGENPHQRGHLYVEQGAPGVAAGTLLGGKELSYNNFLDLDAAHRAASGPGPDRCAVVKHTNTCGLAEAGDQPEAFRRALSGDPVAAFGSILGFNKEVTAETARAITDSGLFVECIAAPGYSEGARRTFSARRNLRLVAVPPHQPVPGWEIHRIGGGLLAQERDSGPAPAATWQVVTDTAPDEVTLGELSFAMRAVALLKSNAVCVTRERTLRGAGAGLMSRIDACILALEKAQDHVHGAVLASDGFFPFDDCVRAAARAGIVAIVQPGGSKRDPDVIDACNELGIALVFTGRRHFRH